MLAPLSRPVKAAACRESGTQDWWRLPASPLALVAVPGATPTHHAVCHPRPARPLAPDRPRIARSRHSIHCVASSGGLQNAQTPENGRFSPFYPLCRILLLGVATQWEKAAKTAKIAPFSPNSCQVQARPPRRGSTSLTPLESLRAQGHTAPGHSERSPSASLRTGSAKSRTLSSLRAEERCLDFARHDAGSGRRRNHASSWLWGHVFRSVGFSCSEIGRRERGKRETPRTGGRLERANALDETAADG